MSQCPASRINSVNRKRETPNRTAVARLQIRSLLSLSLSVFYSPTALPQLRPSSNVRLALGDTACPDRRVQRSTRGESSVPRVRCAPPPTKRAGRVRERSVEAGSVRDSLGPAARRRLSPSVSPTGPPEVGAVGWVSFVGFCHDLAPALCTNARIRNKGHGTVRDRPALPSAPAIFKSPPRLFPISRLRAKPHLIAPSHLPISLFFFYFIYDDL